MDPGLGINPALGMHPAPLERIVLTGFMAAGKSTTGRLLAARLGWSFLDLDEEIESSAGRSVAEIFRVFGEDSFRVMEHDTVAKLLVRQEIILALGGGAIEDERTRRLLFSSEGTRLIYLSAPLQTLLDRCGDTATVRPVLADRTHLQARFERRLPHYQQSHHTVGVEMIGAEAVVDRILVELGMTTTPDKSLNLEA